MSIKDRAELTSRVSIEGPEGGSLGLQGQVALIAALAGAVGSLGLMLRAGHRNPSFLLIVLFAIWVLSPFVALAWTTVASRSWSVVARMTVFVVTLVVSLGGLAIYSAFSFGYLSAKTGFIFLVVPAASWLLIAIFVPIAALISGRLSRQEGR